MIVQNNIRKRWGTKLVEYFISFSATTHQIKYLLIFQVLFTIVFFLSFFGETFYCFDSYVIDYILIICFAL